jgi:hypothetical protein
MPQRITPYNEAENTKAIEHNRTTAKMTTELVSPTLATVGQYRKEPAMCPTDNDAIVPPRPQAKLDKSSWEYIIKTGVAGGLAGCAVCHCSLERCHRNIVLI